MKKFCGVCLGIFALLLFSCTDNQEKKSITKKPSRSTKSSADIEKKIAVTYKLVTSKDSIKAFTKTLDTTALQMLASVNRSDVKFLKYFDTIIAPNDFKLHDLQYFPFPFSAPFLNEVDKIIYFSYATQTFAAYEYGTLVRTGPTSMGRRADVTPTGLFYTNWKAEETISTFNDEWELKWNFNIENKLGVGFHQYEMPGYPASHSCLRLYEKDAKFLYEWADQWKIKGTDDIIHNGTPVIVFGSYPFGSPKPWQGLAQNAEALTINVNDLEKTTTIFMGDIIRKQTMRDSLQTLQ